MSVESLLTTVSKPERIEVLVAYDDDDIKTEEYLQTDWTILPHKIFKFKRWGYSRLHEYYNELARQATGNWLLLWNDDAIMQSINWDGRINIHTGWFGLLRAQSNHQHPFALFPIVPKEWVEVFGTFSPVNHSDWWAYHVCAPMNKMKNIDVQIFHDRHDVTGNNNDEIYKERSYDADGKNPNNPYDYSNPERVKDLIEWRKKILTL